MELCLLKVHINKLCGVKQGVVFFSVFFAIYVDNLIVKFRDSGEGCCINGLYLRFVMYAGDIVLLLASLTSLQKMITLCDSEAQYLDMQFNVTCSAVLSVGSCFKHACACMSFYGDNLQCPDKPVRKPVYELRWDKCDLAA